MGYTKKYIRKLSEYQDLENSLIEAVMRYKEIEKGPTWNVYVTELQIQKVKEEVCTSPELEQAISKINDIMRFPVLADTFVRRRQIIELEKLVARLHR